MAIAQELALLILIGKYTFSLVLKGAWKLGYIFEKKKKKNSYDVKYW